MTNLITEARELCERATPGPWIDVTHEEYSTIDVDHTHGENIAMVGSSIADAAFIAASRTLVPQLCDALEAMTASAEKAEVGLSEAVAAMKLIADEYREKVGDDGICGLCKQDANHGLDGDANECAGFYKDDCFEWRGPQAGEGGRRNEQI